MLILILQLMKERRNHTYGAIDNLVKALGQAVQNMN